MGLQAGSGLQGFSQAGSSLGHRGGHHGGGSEGSGSGISKGPSAVGLEVVRSLGAGGGRQGPMTTVDPGVAAVADLLLMTMHQRS